MKGREHLTFRYETDGKAKGFCVEADSTGYVRGHLFQNQIPIEKPLENWDLSPFFGEGTVTLSRLVEGAKLPQTGTTEIKFRNIAKDLSWYFAQSEQVNTAFNTSIQFDRQGRVIGAGGLFLQAVPYSGGHASVSGQVAEGDRNAADGQFAEESADGNFFGNIGRSAQTADSGKISDSEYDILCQKVENAFRAMPSIGNWFAEKGKREDVIYGLFREFKPTAVLERDVIFNCPCSAESFASSIKAMGKAELDDIIKNDSDPLEVTCHNCGSVYKITKNMLK